ncbi:MULTISPECIES: hypothetical protein [Paenibacillus]|uniref:Uncharacterized protein n=1 Tax=Paenibacillus amylolyticus TaxID=1451 RepID=A0ABD8AW73_PAEAM|nr:MULTISPECIES: hypothetical protein [Paenibacillus]ETT50423.1 hypothetical protein C170_15775 [Paenibacillus sp. FSL H7-689]OME97488.1 hypothetical protein BK124_15940 [Paenibacillus amylolyticus]
MPLIDNYLLDNYLIDGPKVFPATINERTISVPYTIISPNSKRDVFLFDIPLGIRMFNAFSKLGPIMSFDSVYATPQLVLRNTTGSVNSGVVLNVHPYPNRLSMLMVDFVKGKMNGITINSQSDGYVFSNLSTIDFAASGLNLNMPFGLYMRGTSTTATGGGMWIDSALLETYFT